MVAYYLNDVEDHSILLQHFKSLFYGQCSSYSDGFENYELPATDKLFKKLKILVSTQVVEVSLDIDFEQGFTEPAPIDAIVQCLGRINRYTKRSPTKVRIFSKQSHSYNIYDADLTDKSLKVLSSLPNPLGEEDLNQAADRVYGKDYSCDNKVEYEEGLNYNRLKKFKKFLIAGTDSATSLSSTGSK